MPNTTVTITVAGLVALVVKEGRSKAAAALMAHSHRHVPLLLVPDAAVDKEDAFATTRRVKPDEFMVRSRIPPTGFRAYLVDGIDIAMRGRPQSAQLRLNNQNIQGLECPPNADFSAIEWLLDLSAAHSKSFKFNKFLKKQNAVRTILGIEDGTVMGHEPVETGACRKFTYKDQGKRAYTDAFQWQQTYTDSPAILLTPREGEAVAITLKANANCLLLNLPIHAATPGEHVQVFNGLPFDTPAGIEAAKDTTEECNLGQVEKAPSQGGHGHAPFLGDSFCMAVMLEANGL